MASADLVAPWGRRLLATTVVVAVFPLLLVGAWVTRGAARTGRDLLRAQLASQLDQLAAEVERAGQARRADLLMLAENEPVRLLLTGKDSSATVPRMVESAFRVVPMERLVVRDHAGRVRFTLSATVTPVGSSVDRPVASPGLVPLRVPITDLVTGDTIGEAEGLLRVSELLPAAARPTAKAGPLLAVSVRSVNVSRPPDVDPRLFEDERVSWAGERWTSVRRSLSVPDMELTLAGALSPYEQPFAEATRRSALILFATSMLVLIGVLVTTRRLTRAVERTIAQREALATVGEFASELSHEVRNPLTAMRLDLQRAQEEIDNPLVVGVTLSRVLQQVDRLNRAVTGALQVTRSGSMEPQPVELRQVIEAAQQSATPEFARRDARLRLQLSEHPIHLSGDPGALEQLFLNLFINAAQAMPTGGEAVVAFEMMPQRVVVSVRDTGNGMSPAELARTAAPFQSTKRDGTGLGLKIARRIVHSHGGTMHVDSAPGVGTTVRVELPLDGQDW